MKIRRNLAVSGQLGWGERDARAAAGGALADAPQTPARRSRARGSLCGVGKGRIEGFGFARKAFGKTVSAQRVGVRGRPKPPPACDGGAGNDKAAGLQDGGSRR